MTQIPVSGNTTIRKEANLCRRLPFHLQCAHSLLKFFFLSYRHVFSGAKRPRREEAKGGILGDEMGLGKSLVILSTIASSLERSQQFVNTENQVPLLQPKAKVPSGATLILAPSSCKFPNSSKASSYREYLANGTLVLIDNWADEIHKLVPMM